AGAGFVFLKGAFIYAWDEDFPNAGLAQGTHLMEAAIPVVEVANDADPLGIWGPDGKACAGDAVGGAEVRTQLIVDAAFVAFAEEIEIGFAEGRQEGIGIARAMDLAGFVGNDEVVGINSAAVFGGAFEDVAFGDALEFDGRLVFFEDGLDFDF